MADFNNAIMTTEGAALLAATTAGNARLKFLKLVTGSGSYTESEKTRGSLQARTSLKAQKQEFPFSSISMASDTCVKLVALVSNATLAAGYYVNEVGIYAKDELDENADPVLYSIAIANVADYLPPYNGLIPSTITQEYFATVDNALEVTIQTKVGAVALAEDLDILSKTVEDVLKQINNITENILGEKTGDATEFESESVYKSGDYCLHNGILYKCVQDTEGEWNAASWKSTNTLEEIGATQKKLEEVFCLCNENKQKLVENLIARGVHASTSETWEDLLNKVLDMTDTSSDTVTEAAMLAGYTAHNAAGELVTGIIPELAAVTVNATSVTQDDAYTYFGVPEGHYNAASKVRSANSNIESIYYLGSGTTFDIASKFPDDYTKFTVDNFIVEALNLPPGNGRGLGSASKFHAYAEGFTVNKEYTSGILTVSGLTQQIGVRNNDTNVADMWGGSPQTLNIRVYLVTTKPWV